MKHICGLVSLVVLLFSLGTNAAPLQTVCDDCTPVTIPDYAAQLLAAADLDPAKELGPSGMVHLPTFDAFVAFAEGQGFKSFKAFVENADPAIIAAILRYHLIPYSVVDSQILALRGFQADTALSPAEYQLLCGAETENAVITTLINKNEVAIIAGNGSGTVQDVIQFCGPYIVRTIDSVLDPCPAPATAP